MENSTEEIKKALEQVEKLPLLNQEVLGKFNLPIGLIAAGIVSFGVSRQQSS